MNKSDARKQQKREERLRAALVRALNGKPIRAAVWWDVLREWDSAHGLRDELLERVRDEQE